jgi:ABC-type nitrate/sulfonate/bicarbonate transport system substrate-binding protein
MNAVKKIAAGAVLLAAGGTALAQRHMPLEVIAFPGGGNWPVWAAEDKGLFTKNGVVVKLSFTPNSVEQIRNLMSGKYDFGTTAYDNVVAYQEAQGETELPAQPDLFAFMGGYSGSLRFVTQPDIKTYAALKGKTVGVDAATTGFAFILYKLAAMNGLSMSDYKIEKLGGTPSRVQALMEGKIAGTMISSPSELLPESKGFTRLGDTTATFGPYQASVGIARRAWAAKHGDELVAFIRAYAGAMDWLQDPSNKDAAVAIYMKHIPNSPRPAAQKAYETMFGANEGFQKKAKIDLEGCRTVLKLRSEFAKPEKSLTDPLKYIDESYYARAMR